MAKINPGESKVKEPEVEYLVPRQKKAAPATGYPAGMAWAGISPSKPGISNLFGAGVLYYLSPFEKMSIIKEGVSKKDLEQLKATTGLDYDQLSQALSVTRATLINKKGQEKFSATISERIVSVADIFSYGYEVFEDIHTFNQWVHKPNKALGGQKPYDLLDNQYGREEVKHLIGRIDYGVYS